MDCFEIVTFRGFLRCAFAGGTGVAPAYARVITAHSSLELASGALVCSMLVTLLHSTVSGLRQHILGITPGIRFSDHPTEQMHAVGTCSRFRLCVRAICRLLRSASSFCVAVGLLLSAGFHGGEYRSRMDMSAPILVHFGPSPAFALATCVNSFWLVHPYDGSGAGSLALAIATRLRMFVASSLQLYPISSRFSD